VREEGVFLLEELTALQADHAEMGDVRGIGLMLGIEIVDQETGEPAPEAAARIQRAALERGLILELGGRFDAVVRLLPPLNVTRETIHQSLEILRAALSEPS
jgi:diaminobutyrate-2-oxoglutarate transaminase